MKAIARGFYRKFLEGDEEKLERKTRELDAQHRKIHKKTYKHVMTQLEQYHMLNSTVRGSLKKLCNITRCVEFFDDKIVSYPRYNKSSS